MNMNGFYFTDKVRITPVTRNLNFRTEEEGYPFESKAYVEELDKVVYDSTGEPLNVSKKVFLPSDVKIKEGDLVLVTWMHGELAEDEEEEKVMKASKVGSFHRSHIEAMV